MHPLQEQYLLQANLLTKLSVSTEKALHKELSSKLTKGERKSLHCNQVRDDVWQYCLSSSKSMPAALAIANTVKDGIVIFQLAHDEFWFVLIEEGLVNSYTDAILDLNGVAHCLVSAIRESERDISDFKIYCERTLLNPDGELVEELKYKSILSEPSRLLENHSDLNDETIQVLLKEGESKVKFRELTKKSASPNLLYFLILSGLLVIAYLMFFSESKEEGVPQDDWGTPETNVADKLKDSRLDDLKASYDERLSEERLWLSKRLSLAKSKPQFSVFLQVYEALPLSKGGWDLSRIRYITDNSIESGYLGDGSKLASIVETEWQRSNLGTPRTLNSSFSDSVSISIDEEWNTALVWLQSQQYEIPLLKVEVQTHIENTEFQLADLVSDFQTANLVFVINESSAHTRAETLRWPDSLSDLLGSTKRLINYQTTPIEVQGAGLQDLILAFKILDQYPLILVESIVLTTSEGFARWSIKSSAFDTRLNIVTLNELERIIDENN